MLANKYRGICSSPNLLCFDVTLVGLEVTANIRDSESVLFGGSYAILRFEYYYGREETCCMVTSFAGVRQHGLEVCGLYLLRAYPLDGSLASGLEVLELFGMGSELAVSALVG